MPIDSHQLGELLDRHWAILVAWIGGERADAEDVVQQAFIKLAQEDPIPDNCRAWLFTVSKRIAINARISSSKRLLRERSTASLPSQSPSAVSTSEVELHDLLNQLETKVREVVIAKVWGGLTLDEIGVALGTSTATVWRIYQHGISQLQKILGETP